jgi:hypothetical protein
MRSSNPFLHLARKYGVPYGHVLAASDMFMLLDLSKIAPLVRQHRRMGIDVNTLPYPCQAQVLELTRDFSVGTRHLAELDQDLYDEYEYHLRPTYTAPLGGPWPEQFWSDRRTALLNEDALRESRRVVREENIPVPPHGSES